MSDGAGITLLTEPAQPVPCVTYSDELHVWQGEQPPVIKACYREIRFLLDANEGGIIVFVLVTYGDGRTPGSWHCKTFADDLTVEEIAARHICACWLWPSCARPR